MPAVILAPFVVFLWDDPAATDRVWWIAIPWLLLPVALRLSVIGMWRFRRHGKTAARFALRPIFAIIALVVAFQLAV